MHRRHSLDLRSLFGCFALFALSCSGNNTPLAPAAQQALDPEIPLAFGGYIGQDVAEAPFGRFQLTVDAASARVEPARLATAAFGTHFNVDVTDAFSSTFCQDCLRVVDFEKIPEGVRVQLEVEHPFGLADGGAPVSASNRRDLWLSTVKGIVLMDGNLSWLDGEVTLNWYNLINADGHTSLLNPPPGLTANAFPYKVFGANGPNLNIGNFDGSVGWALNYDDPNGYLVLGNAQTARATYDLALINDSSVTWDIVLTAAYAVSASVKDQRLTPTHFMPAGTAPEAWKVRVTPAGTLQAGVTTSSTGLAIEVLDWQQDPALAVDPNFPDPANRRGLAVSSRIAEVHLGFAEMTGIEDINIDLSGASGAGTAVSPWQVTTTLTNTMGLNEGRYYGVVKVVDERDPADAEAPVTFIANDLVTPYGPPAEFATYGVFSVAVVADGGCLPFDQFAVGDGENYTDPAPLYEIADSRAELDSLVAQLTSKPIAFPPIDFSTQKVVVACTGWTDSASGARTADVLSICPNAANGYLVTIERGDPIGGCPTLPIPTAPYVLALFDSLNPEYTFAEEQVDTCGTGPCTPVSFSEVDTGDAWLLGGSYFGGPQGWLALDPTEYQTIAETLYGTNPIPTIDFRDNVAIITTAGLSSPQDGDRYAAVTEICQGAVGDEVEVRWEHGEYQTCTANGEFPSTPFQIISVPKPVAAATFTESIVDICKPGGNCDNPLSITMMAQADVHGAAAGPGTSARHTSPGTFATDWDKYFPEVQAPSIDFDDNDAWIIALDQVVGTGVERIELVDVCEDVALNSINVAYNHYMPMGPGCASADTLASRLVTVFTTPKSSLPGNPTVNFIATPSDFCDGVGCGGPVGSLLDEGNGAANWTQVSGTQMAIFDQPTLNRVWQAVKGGAATAPTIDFRSETVVFSTTGFHPEGAELWDLEISSACEFGSASSMFYIDKVPQTCPPPLPVATTPYEFVSIPSGGPGQIPAYNFTRSEIDACDPGADCEPTFGNELASGDYPENLTPGQSFATASSPAELTSIWNTFFTNAATRPPQPTVDFSSTDVILTSSGFTPDGSGQRTRNAFFLCIDVDGEYLRVDSFLGEPLSCTPEPGASHPWSCTEIPKGSAGYTIELQDDVFDTCAPPPDCFDFEELGASKSSTWASADSKYVLLANPDLDLLKREYRTAWEDLGTGDPPGVDSLVEGDAVVVLIYGWRGAPLGLHDIRMTDYCFNAIGILEMKVQRETPLSGCNGVQVPTSPYAIYKVPNFGESGNFTESTIDSCPP